jgi:hypothetical protein
MRVIEREITATKEGKPVMVLKPVSKYDKTYIDETTGRPYKKRHFILLDEHLWIYSETHNPAQFLEVMTAKTQYLCTLFGIEVPTRKREYVRMMTSISDTITNGIDDLVKAPPIAPEPEQSNIITLRPVPIPGIEASGIIH